MSFPNLEPISGWCRERSQSSEHFRRGSLTTSTSVMCNTLQHEYQPAATNCDRTLSGNLAPEKPTQGHGQAQRPGRRTLAPVGAETANPKECDEQPSSLLGG